MQTGSRQVLGRQEALVVPPVRTKIVDPPTVDFKRNRTDTPDQATKKHLTTATRSALLDFGIISAAAMMVRLRTTF
jgi:hypothetical protein